MIQPNLADILKESDSLRSAFGLPPLNTLTAGVCDSHLKLWLYHAHKPCYDPTEDEDTILESVNAIAVSPKCLYVAVKRQNEDSLPHPTVSVCVS